MSIEIINHDYIDPDTGVRFSVRAVLTHLQAM